MPWPRVVSLATLPAALGVLAVGAAGVAVSASAAAAGPGGFWAEHPSNVWFVAAVLAATPSVVLGVAVSNRQPANVVGPLLGLIGLVPAAIAATDAYLDAAATAPGRLPVWDVLASLGVGAWVWLYVPLGLLLLVFPDGRALDRRWRAVGIGLVCVATLFTLLAATAPEPYPAPYQDAPHALGTLGDWSTYVGYGLLPVFLGLLAACAMSLCARYRRADERARAQLKWMALAGLSLPLTLLLCWASYLLLSSAELVVVGLVVMVLAVPLATGLAMLRHDLYDVDRALSAALTSALVGAGLLFCFSVVSILGGLMLGRGSALVAAAATAVCALVLAPLRRRCQAWVADRRYPLRARALASVAALQQQVHAGSARPEALQDTLRDALADAALQVGYRVPGFDDLVDGVAAPVDVSGRHVVEVRVGDVAVGALVSGPTPNPPTALLQEVATFSALLVEVVRLRLEVRQALREAEASRARLVHAGYAERRRLEHDLHDGAQQRLVSLGISLRLAQRHIEDGTVDVGGLLDATVAELATSVAELRQLAHGLRPSSLDEGLGPALTSLTSTLNGSRVNGSGAPRAVVDLELDPALDDVALPDDVSATAYYVASEAVANAVKHADADRIDLSVARRNGSVRVRVSDNGRGGATARPGSGLSGLHDRVNAIDGALLLHSPPDGGTVLEARLPCAS